jgi:hypothetical protein
MDRADGMDGIDAVDDVHVVHVVHSCPLTAQHRKTRGPGSVKSSQGTHQRAAMQIARSIPAPVLRFL